MNFYSISLILIVLVSCFDAKWDNTRYDVGSESLETEIMTYCPKNEEWWDCGTGCEKSCTHPKQPTNCKLPCIPFSCRCKHGLYRDNQGSGRCVRRHKCQKWSKK